MLFGSIREMFDIMTLYKPLNVLIDEGKSVVGSVLRLFGVFLFFSLLALLPGLMNTDTAFQFFLNNILPIWIFFSFLVLQATFSSIAVYALSRFFSGKGTFTGFLGLNFFLLACSSVFTLVSVVPFAEFPGLILFFLGWALYLYFLGELIEIMFGLSFIKSLGLLVVYLGSGAGLYFGINFVLGLFNIKV